MTQPPHSPEAGRRNEPDDPPGFLRRLVGPDLLHTLEKEFRDLYRFYLDTETRDRLESMWKIQRAFWLLGWLLKSLLLKLSPARRLLLMLAILLSIMGWTTLDVVGFAIRYDLRPWGCLLLLFILMLELKDKLVAKDEIQFGRRVQQALMPERHPDIQSWSVWSCSEPANDIGGDLVDYIALPPGRVGVVLGDVAGKGLGAALLSAKLQASLRVVGPESPSLDELGARMNAILGQDGLDNRFATLFYAEISDDSGHVRYLNAGHNPPFILRNNGSVDELPASSFPLGMLPSARYREGLLELDPGEMMLIYSDGLPEAVDAEGTEFGNRRIRALLTDLKQEEIETAGRMILEDVRAFLGTERPQDDLSIILLRREM